MKYNEISAKLTAEGKRFAIVAARFNDLFTKQLVAGALDAFERHGAKDGDVTVVWVPGTFEEPAVIQKLAESGKYDAIVALGAVVQGATSHAGLIGGGVTRAMVQIAVKTGCPVIDGVVTAESIEQAIERCGTKAGNRGYTAATTAIEMASLMGSLP